MATNDEILVDNGKRTMTLDELAHTQPGMARIMPEVGVRIWKTYYAAEARNWPLARFELKEAVNLMEKGAFLRPKYTDNMAKFIDEEVAAVTLPPSFLKAGFRVGIFLMSHFAGSSSLSTR